MLMKHGQYAYLSVDHCEIASDGKTNGAESVALAEREIYYFVCGQDGRSTRG